MVEAEVSPGHFRPFEVTAVHLIYVGLGFFIAIVSTLQVLDMRDKVERRATDRLIEEEGQIGLDGTGLSQVKLEVVVATEDSF